MTSFPLPVHHTLSGANQPEGSATVPMRMSIHEAGNGDGVVPVVFCHGFPDLAYTWRDQLRGVADAGFRAIAAPVRKREQHAKDAHRYVAHVPLPPRRA